MRGRKRLRKKRAKKLAVGLSEAAVAARRAAEEIEKMSPLLIAMSVGFQGLLTKPTRFKAYPGESITIQPRTKGEI